MKRLVLGGLALSAACLLFQSPDADADAGPGVPSLPFGGSPGVGAAPGLGQPGPPNLTPAAATIFLCPGVGGAAEALLGIGGGYCDFDFTPVQLTATSYGVMHIHCEWGGLGRLLEMWNCWRVFPGQPDHPAHVDPDIIPDGWGVPWAIQGPSPTDQWPPPGLAPAPLELPPPPDLGPPRPPPPEGPPPGPPPPEG